MGARMVVKWSAFGGSTRYSATAVIAYECRFYSQKEISGDLHYRYKNKILKYHNDVDDA